MDVQFVSKSHKIIRYPKLWAFLVKNFLYYTIILGISFLVQWALEKEIHYPSFTEETIILNGKPMEVFNALSLIQIGIF